MPDLKVGDAVLYSPHECHQLDQGFVPGEVGWVPLFHFAHAKAYGGSKPGDRVDPGQVGNVTGWEGKPHASGLLTDKGCVLAHAGPKHYWPATVLRVNADGTCDLLIEHPCGFRTLEYPDREAHPSAPGVRHDPKGKAPHTFHLAEG